MHINLFSIRCQRLSQVSAGLWLFLTLTACSETGFQSSETARNTSVNKSDKSGNEDNEQDEQDNGKSSGKNKLGTNAKDDDIETDDDSDLDNSANDSDNDNDTGSSEEEFPKGADVEIDEGTLSTTPGQLVEQIGVHFEDGSDNDFNDISVCFKGKFKVDGIKITSVAKQAVDLAAKRISGIAHTYKIEFIKTSGENIDTFSGTPASGEIVNHSSKIYPGTTLKIETTTANGTKLDLNNKSRSRVELNTCRNTGT